MRQAGAGGTFLEKLELFLDICKSWSFYLLVTTMVKSFASSLEPPQVLQGMKDFVDTEEVDPSTRTMFHGTRPIIGRFETSTFRLHRRQLLPWGVGLFSPGRWFKPSISGTIRQQNDGSELFLEGGASLIIKVAWVLLILAVAAVGGAIIVFNYPVTISFDPANSGAYILRGLAIMTGVLGILLLLPLLGWLMTRKDLDFIAGELQRHLGLKELPLR